MAAAERALEASPALPPALFNAAIALEQMQLFDAALERWASCARDSLIAITEVLTLARRRVTGGYSREHLDALGSK